jgi:S-formylglutathione hydrolase FrmB
LLLHGAEGDQNFFPKGLGREELAKLAGQYGIILLMPDGLPFGWYLDSPLVKENQIATYIMQELLPDAMSRYPIDPNRLALLGISMGGHGSLTLALNNPGRFKAVSTLSAVIDLESHQTDSNLDRYLKVEDLLGPAEQNSDLWRSHSAYFMTRQNPGALADVALKITIGLNDKLCLAENRQYDRLLTELGVHHQYLEESGGHGWKLWKPQFPKHLQFLVDNL